MRAQDIAGAPDLRAGEPRPLGLELEGYAHLPRMLDKARASLAGTAGTYMFGCPVDHTCMARLGVTPELVLDLAGRHADDGAVLAALREHGIPSAEEAWFDAVAVEDELQEEDVYLRVRSRDALPERDVGRVFAGAEHGADVDVVLVDAAPGASRGPFARRSAEVWVIQDGEATFWLGDHQARTVRAGEVVRIPAGASWRYENRGQATLRAVAVTSM